MTAIHYTNIVERFERVIENNHRSLVSAILSDVEVVSATVHTREHIVECVNRRSRSRTRPEHYVTARSRWINITENVVVESVSRWRG